MHTTKKTIVLKAACFSLSAHFDITLSTHARTHTHRCTYNAGKTNTLLIYPPQGFVGSVWNLRLSRQESTWKRNKGPVPHFTLLFSKVCRNERHNERDYTHGRVHTHTLSQKRFCFGTNSFSSSRSNIDLILESDTEVWASACKQ